MAVTWSALIAREFEKVDFGDKRLNQRCQKVVKAIARHPDKSIPKACGDWGTTQGAYRFFSNENVSREELLAAPIECTVERCRKCSEVLAIQDSSYLNFTSHKATEGLGPIGTTEGLRGLVMHNSLAVESERGEVLGVLYQEVWAREGVHPREETTEERRARERESQCWSRSVQAVESVGLEGVIHVMDREGDIYEVLEILIQQKKRFVIRARHNRRLAMGVEGLFETLRRQPVVGKMVIPVPAKPGQRKRQAVVSLRRAYLTIRPPKTLGRPGAKLLIQVVEVSEEHAPQGCAALKWVLLTSESIESLEDCVRVSVIYSRRWKIEEFHMGLKTGCKIEERQLETRKRLETFLGLCCVISVLLLRLRDAARGDGCATDILSDVQLILLRSKIPGLEKSPTAREALRAVARLGGFLARKGDGEPGWRSLWEGMNQLLIMEQGYLFAKNDLLLPSTDS